MNERLNKIQQLLKDQQIECGFITSRHNIFYFTNFDYEPHERFIGLFVFQNEKPILVVPAMELAMVKEAGWTQETLCYSDTDNIWELIKGKVKRLTALAVEKQKISYLYIENLKEMNPSLKLFSIDEIVNNMRIIKSQDEVEILQEAAMYADLAVKFGIEALKEGISEIEVMAEIEFALRKRGIREMSFAPVVLFGENASNPHGFPSDRRLQNGDVVLFDLGVKFKGYSSDITRTVVFDYASEEIEKIYNIVLNANQAGINACKSNMRMGDVDAAARSVIADSGYGEKFPHRIGHGLGIDVHESPSLTGTNQDILKAGMVITIEPGIYLNGVAGIRIEDDVVITENGRTVLTKFPKTMLVIKPKECNENSVGPNPTMFV